MRDLLLCPSMMCADFLNLQEEVRNLEEAGCQVFHMDIMDGTYVPNFTLGTNDVKAIKRCTDRLVDVHLMIENPANKVDWFINAGADIVYIHPEADMYPGKTLRHIREMGKHPGIAINPDTSVETIKELLPLCDYVMAMTVYPGFAGQKFVESTKGKLKALAELKKEFGYKLVIDGSCSPTTVKECNDLGVDGFVLGTSAIFGKGRPYKELCDELRNM